MSPLFGVISALGRYLETKGEAWEQTDTGLIPQWKILYLWPILALVVVLMSVDKWLYTLRIFRRNL